MIHRKFLSQVELQFRWLSSYRGGTEGRMSTMRSLRVAIKLPRFKTG